MEVLATMFSTFVLFVAGVMTITEMVNKFFKVQGKTAKLIISWVLSIFLATLGFWQQIGFFAGCGTPDMWQGWVKAALIGLGCGWCANGLYNRDEMWTLLEKIFPLFGKKK